MFKRQIAFVFAGILALAGLAAPVYADERSDSAPESQNPVSGAVLELTPVTMRLALVAGEEKTSTLTLKNTGAEPLDLKIYAMPYSNGDDGESQDFETESTYTQISRWITIKKDDGSYDREIAVAINPKEEKEIAYKISVPESAPGGGQYATIIVEIVPEKVPEDMIQTISRAGMVIYANVEGETQRIAAISDIKTAMTAIGKNIGINFTVSNNGNIDFQATTTIRVSSLGGKILFDNTTVSSVLPENSKTIISEWGDTPRFGIYRLDYVIDALDIHVEGGLYVLSLTPLGLGFLIVFLVLTAIAVFYLLKKHTTDKDEGIIIN